MTPMATFREFCDGVVREMPRATGREKEDVRWELTDHLLEHRDMLVEHGYDEPEAERRAIEAMGDPAEIGRAWNEKLSPFWLWLGRICLAGCLVLVLFAWNRMDSHLTRMWNIWQIQRADTVGELEEVKGYTLVWDKDPGVKEDFGRHVIRVHRAALWKGKLDNYRLQLYIITYPQDISGYSLPSGLILQGMKMGEEVVDIGGSSFRYRQQGYSEAIHVLKIKKGTPSVNLSTEYNGNTFDAEIKIDWEGVQG